MVSSFEKCQSAGKVAFSIGAGWGGEAGGGEKRVFRRFLNLFSLLCFVLHTEDFTTSMTALMVQCLLSLTARQDTIKMLFLHHWLVKKCTSMIEIHNYNFTIGLSQVFPNSSIFTDLATCQFAGHL